MTPRVFIFAGSDDFEVKKQVRSFLSELLTSLTGGEEALECIEFGSDLDEWLAAMLRALQTPSFFSPYQVVYLKHFPYLEEFASGKTDMAKAAMEYLEQSLSESQTIVIDGGAVDQRKAYAKILAGIGELRVFNSAKSNDKNFIANRQQLIRERCTVEKKSMDLDAMRYLMESLPADSGVFDQEMEKLFTYMGKETRIHLADCQAITAKTPEAMSWSFTEALCARDAAGALRLLGILLDSGEADMRLMSAIAGEFQKLIQVKAALRELKIDPAMVNPRTFDSIGAGEKSLFPDNVLLGMHPYRAYKVSESSGRFSDSELVVALEAAAKANLALVSGGGDRRVVLEQLILKICRAE